MNEFSRIVIYGKDLATRLVSRDTSSLVQGMFFARFIRVNTIQCLYWGWWLGFEVKVGVRVGSIPVDRHGDRAIILSGCF